MNDYIDLYCERLTPGLLSEPLNALSNVSFFIAAWAIWRLVQQRHKNLKGVWLLMGLVVLIGAGSFLFHTFATRWSNLLDVLPILLFQLCFIWLYSRQVIKMNHFYCVVLAGAFYFVSNYSKQFVNVLNGSLSYAPAFLVLLGFGLYHYYRGKREPFILLTASGVFLLSLLFRTLDQAICPYFSTGTHFLWHFCNGGLLYLSTRGLILNWSNKAKTQSVGT